MENIAEGQPVIPVVKPADKPQGKISFWQGIRELFKPGDPANPVSIPPTTIQQGGGILGKAVESSYPKPPKLTEELP